MNETLTLDEMTTTALRAECKRRGIAYSGNDRKADLVAKLAPSTPEPTFEDAVAAVLNGADPIAVADALVGTPVASTDKVERLRLAQVEHKAMKAWRKAGAKGDAPATPNLDAVEADSVSAPRTGLGAKRKRASISASRPEKAAKVSMTFLRNGVEMPRSANKFSCLAYQCTKNLDGDAPRVSASRLREILAAAPYNLSDVESTTWEVTLPNGFTIGARPAS